MIKIFCFFTLILFNIILSGCSIQKKTQIVTSPCVAGNGGPCDRYSVNDWWIHGEDKPRLVKAIV